MGYLGDKVKKIHKMGVKVVDSVTKFGEKQKGKLAVAGMVGSALAHLSDKPKKQGTIYWQTPHTPYHQDSAASISAYGVVGVPPAPTFGKSKGYGKKVTAKKEVGVPAAPTFGKSKGYGKKVTRLPGPTQQGRAEADFRSAVNIARQGERSGAENRIKHEQKSRRDKTIKGKISNTKANAKMLSDAVKLMRGTNATFSYTSLRRPSYTDSWICSGASSCKRQGACSTRLGVSSSFVIMSWRKLIGTYAYDFISGPPRSLRPP
jgi:hypothetical protein